MTKWISVTERLPEENGRYLLRTGEWSGDYTSFFIDGEFYDEDTFLDYQADYIGRDGNITDYVSHWMPIPK